MGLLSARGLAIGPLFLGMACHAIIGFEEGTPLGEGGAAAQATASGATDSAATLSTAASTDATTAASSADTTTGQGGNGGNGGNGGGGGGSGGIGGADTLPPAACEAGPRRIARYGDGAKQDGCIGALSPDASVMLGGAFHGSLDFGGTPLTAPGGQDAFVAFFDPAGELELASAYTGAPMPGARGVQALSLGLGGSLLGGSFRGSIGLDSALTAKAGADGFVVRFSQSEAISWSAQIPGAGDQTVNAVAIAGSTSRAIVGGGVRGVLDLGGEPISTAGVTRGYLATFALANGDFQVASLVGIPGDNFVQALGLDDDAGELVVALAGPQGGVALVDDDGEVWTKPLGAPVFEAIFGEDGDIYVSGEFTGRLSMDDEEATSEGASDVFIARLDRSTGVASWLRRIGGIEAEDARGLVQSCDGRLVAVLAARSPIEVAGRELPAAGGVDIVAVRLDPETGVVVSGSRYGGDGDQIPMSLTQDGGAPLVTGTFEGTLEFDGEVLESSGDFDLFVAQLPLAPAGEGD